VSYLGDAPALVLVIAFLHTSPCLERF